MKNKYINYIIKNFKKTLKTFFNSGKIISLLILTSYKLNLIFCIFR